MCFSAFLQESGIELGPGLFFSDGKRKVDYVLCYKYKKKPSKPRLSLIPNGTVPVPTTGRCEVEAESGDGGAPAGEVEESKLTEEEKALMREEFEAGLMEAGLQLQRDKEVRFCFYSPFNVIIFHLLHTSIDVYGSELTLSDVNINPVMDGCQTG